MWVDPCTPNVADYTTFLANIIQSPEVPLLSDVLPLSFSGTGTLIQGSNVLTIVSVSSGSLSIAIPYLVIADQQGAIPANTTLIAQLSGTPGGVGTYQMSNLATATVGTAETITATNWQIVWTLALAVDMVNEAICAASPTLYTLACYNFATDRLINFAQDTTGQEYFQRQRAKLHILDVGPMGTVASASDSGTSAGVLNPEQMRMLTLQDIQMLKTPWGRAYMGIAQSYAPNIWGLT